MSDNHEEIVTLIYMGQRFVNGSLQDTFMPKDDTTKVYSFHRKPSDSKHRHHLIIGHAFDVGVTEGKSFALGSCIDRGPSADSNKIREWSMLDRAARDEKATHNSIKKLKSENDEAWLEAMAPIHRAYRMASSTGRRAIKVRLLEMLEKGG